MTQKDLINRLSLLAKSCDFQMPPDLMSLYDRALRRFGYDRASAAVEAAIIERRGNEKMPSIGDLVARCAPQVLDQDTAVEVAGRIITAITKFGWCGASDASGWIGDIGWYVVQNNGGWVKLCETVRERDITTWRAQLRDQAAAAIRRQKAGLLGAAPKFGEVAGAPRVAALVGEVLKKSENYDVIEDRNVRGVSPEPEHWQLNAKSHS